MKKISLVFVVSLVLALFLMQPVMAVEVIKCGHAANIEHPAHQALVLFKEMVELRTDDYVVEIYPNAQLGTEEELCEMIRLGTVTCGNVARFEATGMEQYVVGLPFMFKDFDHVKRVFNGPIGDYLASFTEEHGLKSLGWQHSGFRQITNNVRPITKPADLKGIKMRTPPLENIIQTIDALGGNPTSMAFEELYMALKTNVVDGQENPYAQIANHKLYEVQKYCSEVNYIYMPQQICFNLEWWNSIPPEDQEIISDAVKISCEYANYLTESSDKSDKEKAIEGGLEVYELTAEERQAFIDEVQPVYDYFIEKGITTQRLIDLIQNN